MIIGSYSDFRWQFAETIEESGVSLTFSDADPDTITRASGSFTLQGYQEAMTVEPNGTANNDAVYTVAESGVASTVLTLVDGDAVTAEGPVTADIKGYFRDIDGWAEFPGPNATYSNNLVRASGFDGGISIVSVSSDFTTRLTVNASAADSVFGTDEYDWYLSDRTDDPGKRFLDIVQRPSSGGNSYSGSVDISLSALCLSELGINPATTPLTQSELAICFKFAHLYCRRVSDGAIQWVDLYLEQLKELE